VSNAITKEQVDEMLDLWRAMKDRALSIFPRFAELKGIKYSRTEEVRLDITRECVVMNIHGPYGGAAYAVPFKYLYLDNWEEVLRADIEAFKRSGNRDV